jgi:translocation and assembly module TamA
MSRSALATRASRWLPRLWTTMLLLALAGCSSLRGPDEEPPPAPPDAAASAPEAANAAYTLDIEAPGNLKTLLAQNLDLARFRSSGEAGITLFELDRLIAAAPAQARSLLETEGYFDAQVAVTRDDAAPPHVRVAVQPGERVRIADVAIDAQGPLKDAAQAGDAAATKALHEFESGWTLPRGEPFTQSAWTAAKNKALGVLREHGYAQPDWAHSEAVVDPATHSVRLDLVAASGPLFHLGALDVQGLSRYDASVVRNLARYKPGDVYSESRIADFQERLQKAGLFESAVVDVDTASGNAAAAPVHVRVRESPLQQATLGVGVSANTGPRVTLEHVHRRPFGWQATAKNKFELGRDLKSWEGELISHPLPDEYRNLLAAGYSQLDSTDQQLTSAHLRAGRTQDIGRFERTYYVELLADTTRTPLGKNTSEATSLNYNWVTRRLDNVLLPTRGYTASAAVAGGYALSNPQPNGPFARALARITGYVPFGDRWYGQWRLEAGQVFARLDVGVPDSLLFRAGGDDSVRGYAYRSLGPLVNGVLTSGHVLFTSSVEVAHPVSAKLPDVWGAVFIDAGQAAPRWSDLDPALGYGVGVRWRSPVGPLRIDLAYGEEVHKVRLHFSVGIAF